MQGHLQDTSPMICVRTYVRTHAHTHKHTCTTHKHNWIISAGEIATLIFSDESLFLIPKDAKLFALLSFSPKLLLPCTLDTLSKQRP